MIQNLIQGDSSFVPGPFNFINITLFGLSTPFTNAQTDSFIISTFNLDETIENKFYFIDTANQGLFIKSLCSYPCN